MAVIDSSAELIVVSRDIVDYFIGIRTTKKLVVYLIPRLREDDIDTHTT